MEEEAKRLNEKWTTRKIVEETMKSFHNEPSPETRERLKSLEVNQTNIMEKLFEFQQNNKDEHKTIAESMEKFHKSTNDALEKLNAKLDSALSEKADKEEVKSLWRKMDNFAVWKAYIMGMGAVILFIVYALKDYILGKI